MGRSCLSYPVNRIGAGGGCVWVGGGPGPRRADYGIPLLNWIANAILYAQYPRVWRPQSLGRDVILSIVPDVPPRRVARRAVSLPGGARRANIKADTAARPKWGGGVIF